MEVGKKLKDARTQSRMTQEEIALKIKVSRQTISNWENGKSLPDIISLIYLSDIYGMSLDDLLKGNTKMIEKIEKDTNTVKSNQSMKAFGWLMLIGATVFSLWNSYSGDSPLLQFMTSASPWVMMGVGIACLTASMTNKREVDNS